MRKFNNLHIHIAVDDAVACNVEVTPKNREEFWVGLHTVDQDALS